MNGGHSLSHGVWSGCIANGWVCFVCFLQVIAAYPNVCNYLHMPAQSGSSSTLQRMRRGYTRAAYDALVARARQVIPNVALSTDMITGRSFSAAVPCMYCPYTAPVLDFVMDDTSHVLSLLIWPLVCGVLKCESCTVMSFPKPPPKPLSF
jgi:hypothetical protein